MIALKLIPIAQLLLIIFTDVTLSYPNGFYNSRRLSRATQRPSYDAYDYYARGQRYPYGYYPNYQIYPDEYYYSPDAYPMYYLSPRASKYDFLPAYYYQDVPAAKNKNYYYNYNYGQDDEARLMQEIEREQRERAQPIGHEIRYENDYNDEGNVDETNAAFLNNLMMYQDKSSSQGYFDQYPYADFAAENADAINFPKWEDMPVNVEDEDVKELKDLPKKQKQRKTRQRKQRKQKIDDAINEPPFKRSQDNSVVYTDRKPVVKDEEGARRDARGQKEVVMMRPATPVRHPFSNSVLEMMNQQQQEERKRSPSVYDTIRHMLEMEKKYEEENQSDTKTEMRPSMKKRIVSSEDSLTKQLSVLKKAQ